MARRLAGIIIIDGKDDENWPDTHEFVHVEHSVQMILDLGQPAASLEIPDTKWGGECRLELRLDAQVVGAGEVQINGTAKFFEGDSEDSDDLEEEQAVQLTVPRGGVPAFHFLQLVNPGAGDYARIKFSLTNSIIEEV